MLLLSMMCLHYTCFVLQQQPSNPGAQQEQQQPLAVASMDIDASDYDPPNFPLRRLLCFAGITVGYMGLVSQCSSTPTHIRV